MPENANLQFKHTAATKESQEDQQNTLGSVRKISVFLCLI